MRSNSDSQLAIYEENQRSQWDWLGNSALEVSTDNSSATPRDAFLRQNSDESSDTVFEKLKSEVFALSRQAKMFEVELQTLHKQKRWQDLFREIACWKEERDALKGNLKYSLEQISSKRKVSFFLGYSLDPVRMGWVGSSEDWRVN